jgi:ClpP class serine protease
LQVDSFGGEAGGCFELCDKIYAARQRKPIWAVADIDAMSAGYAILSSAEKCYVAPRGSCGSIGVVCVHVERSKMNEALGITYTVFRAGDQKANMNPFESLTPEAAQKVLASMERTREVFANTVSRNRNGLAIATILETEGQWYDPEDGLDLGLIDGIATYEDVFSQLAASITNTAVDAPTEPGAPTETVPTDPQGNPIVPETPETSTKEIRMEPKNPPNAPPAMQTENPAPPATPPAPPAPPSVTAAVHPENVVDLNAARGTQETRAMEIAEACKLSGFPEQAPDYIANTAMSANDVKKKLIDLRAEKDKEVGELSNHHPGKTGSLSLNQPSQEAVGSWGAHFKKAQANNPDFKRSAR